MLNTIRNNMPKKRTQKEFIELATERHSGEYAYSNVTYINNTTKVHITCPNHGEFAQRPKDHLKGAGCPKCALERSADRMRDGVEAFKEKAIKIHGDKYDYSKVEYTTSKLPVVISCPMHGDFRQTPNVHLTGSGCPECGKVLVGDNQAGNTEQFTLAAKKVHSDKYLYNKTEYIRSNKKVTIICPIHGDFEQTPNAHLSGHGCRQCANLKIGESKRANAPGWSFSRWEEYGHKSKDFDSFKVYVIKCWNEDEEFVKIGKTYRTIGMRFRDCHLPYEWKVVKVIEGNAAFISKTELEMQKIGKEKDLQYTPLKKFDGMSECFTVDILKDIEDEN
jgi:hypothetical protein